MKLHLRRIALFAAFSAIVPFCGGATTSESTPKPGTPAVPFSSTSNVVIPGPLRSLLRMAGISQQAAPQDVLPFLARSAALRGYENGHQNEFLRLLNRYVFQARELQTLASREKDTTLHVKGCADSALLLEVLGYRVRGTCGQKDMVLETSDPQRAFLTVDSGFPLADLEEALQNGTQFAYPYPGSLVPVLYKESDWVALAEAQKGAPRDRGNILNILLNDPSVARLYWAMSKKDPETRVTLMQSPGLKKLAPLAAAFDLYGGEIAVRSGRVVVPGGVLAEPAWKELVGANADAPGEFVAHLLAKDTGWLAAYFDVLSRLRPDQQAHLLQEKRLKTLYEDFRKNGYERDATQGVYRKDADLLVLMTLLQWEPTGELHVPGNLDVWKQIFSEKWDQGPVREIGRHAPSWNRPEQLLEALVSCSRIGTDKGPLQIYLQLSEIDSVRPAGKKLSPDTVGWMSQDFARLGNWYSLFSEFPQIGDDSIKHFIAATDAMDKISSQSLRGNVRGAFQANLGIWAILARQGEIPPSLLESSWNRTMEPFFKVTSSVQLFDAAQASLQEAVLAATGKNRISQGELIDLLAGPQQSTPEGQRVRQALAARMRLVLEDQQLVSLDTLLVLGDGLNDLSKGKPVESDLASLAGELREFELPRPIFTTNEKNMWAPAIYNTRHNELRVRTDLAKLIKTGTHVQLGAARGQLTPFLKDTLVGLNYAYYEPPDDQILHHNPLFVRSHDFTGISMVGTTDPWRTPRLLAAGVSAGGGAFLMGSLADLSYMLGEAEQDFIAPVHVQALIWKELVPELLMNATVSRWWNITPTEMHAVALYQRRGEELVLASAKDSELQREVFEILAEHMDPSQLELVRGTLNGQDPKAAMAVVAMLLPSDTFYLAGQFQARFPTEANAWGPLGKELNDLAANYAEDTNWGRLSKDFGIPHPALTFNYSRSLLNLKPLPLYSGFSSRFFAESWESSNLYWARIADERGDSPVMLNLLVPQLTHRMITNIFATDLEDWPAVLRATHATGEEFRQNKIGTPAAATVATTEAVERKAQ